MSKIYELDPKFLGSLLAADRMEVANGALNVGDGAVQIPPDTHNRTILIGIGGTGVKTLNHIKREISQRLQPQWREYIAFLAIDSDQSELEKAPYLKEEEFVNTTRAGVVNTIANGKRQYPQAWLPFVDEAKAREFMAIAGTDGASQRRLMGKMKVHYGQPAERGVDEDIVARLEDAKTRLAPLDGSSKYEVYVIGGLCGGTCSGSFTEMPALIHKALNSKGQTNIKSMLYLPDTLTALVTKERENLMANGYASLKELNYYQGMFMRRGQKETFVYNSDANPTLELDNQDGYFYLPYLIGTANGAKPDSSKIARETIAEFFISILGKNAVTAGAEDTFMVNSFESNALANRTEKPLSAAFKNKEVEAEGSLHEFPKSYGTIGFAKAAAPQSIIRAYTVGMACKKAGLLPISTEDRASKAAAGEKFLPFLGEKQYESVAVVNTKREEMLGALTKYMAGYHKGSFDYATVIPGGAPTWEAIHDGSADDSAVRNRVNGFVTKATDGNAAQALENAVIKQFQTFRDAVKAYVQVNGPMAFYNLYHGHAAAENGKQAQGIRDVLRSMVDDLNAQSGKPNVYADPAAKMKAKNDKGNEIRGQKDGLIDKVWELLYGKKAVHAGEWEKLYNAAVNAEISAKRREYMLGQQGILKRCFLDPAEELCRQLHAFAKILETMSNGYMSNGSKLDEYEAFRTVSEDSTEVNIAALNTFAHSYLQKEATRMADSVDREKVRKALVDSFFDDPEGWLEVEDKLIRRTGDAIGLKSEEMPVSARRKFDQCLKDTISVDMDVTIATLFENIKQDVQPEAFARDILQKLKMQSKPLFDGDLTGQHNLTYIMYPRSLSTSYPEVKDAIEKQAAVMFGSSVGFYASDYADSIMMYQMVAPFEIYRLKELKNWEKEYEVRKTQQANGLHGMSPDTKCITGKDGTITYVEQTPWVDYPAITYSADPQKKNADGSKSHEGKVRDRLEAEIINKAIEMGLLYCDEEDGKYQVYSILMDKSVDWRFNLALMDTDEIGLYPTGADLLREVVEMNKQDLEDLVKPVTLDLGGQTSVAHSTEELAWFYAKKVLFMNRQRLYQIRDTMELVAPWNAAVDKANVDVLKKLKPGKMLRMMMARVYYPNDKQVWCLEEEDSTKPAKIVSTAPAAIDFLDVQDPEMAAIVRAGFTLYYVYTELLRAKADMDAGLAYAKKVLRANEDPEELQEAVAKAQAMMKKESAILTEMDVDLTDPEQKPSKSLMKKMAELEIDDPKTVQELIKFYSYLRFWKKV